jgi:hypothetical protein
MHTPTAPFAVSDLLTLSRAARLIQPRRNNRPTCGSTLFRWATRGLRGIKLQTWRMGKTLVTTERAICEFIVATSEAAARAESGGGHE